MAKQIWYMVRTGDYTNEIKPVIVVGETASFVTIEVPRRDQPGKFDQFRSAKSSSFGCYYFNTLAEAKTFSAASIKDAIARLEANITRLRSQNESVQGFPHSHV